LFVNLATNYTTDFELFLKEPQSKRAEEKFLQPYQSFLKII
jgi:hypothetical protein